MEPISGFVTVPRLAGNSKPAGAFYSAVVLSATGSGKWNVSIDGRQSVISSDMALQPGQALRLKLVSSSPQKFVFQVLPHLGTSGVSSEIEKSALVAAFLSRGLSLASQRLQEWTRWLEKRSGPLEKEGWAASAAARDLGPQDPQLEQLAPWLDWLAALEQGKAPPMPELREFWDHWNQKQVVSGEPWLVVPLTWDHHGQVDSGLLQAHWNAPAQRIDQWNLTASPAAVPFRLEAQCRENRLALSWRVFNASDRAALSEVHRNWGELLSTEELAVSLEFADPEADSRPARLGGIDVQA